MSRIGDAFPDAEVVTLRELQYSSDRKGPWKMYIYEPNSDFHRGGVWFMANPTHPEEGEIAIREAKQRHDAARLQFREIRICDGGDELVYHTKDRRVLHGEMFWTEIGAA